MSDETRPEHGHIFRPNPAVPTSCAVCGWEKYRHDPIVAPPVPAARSPQEEQLLATLAHARAELAAYLGDLEQSRVFLTSGARILTEIDAVLALAAPVSSSPPPLVPRVSMTFSDNFAPRVDLAEVREALQAFDMQNQHDVATPPLLFLEAERRLIAAVRTLLATAAPGPEEETKP